MTEKPYMGLFGYTAQGRTFMDMGVENQGFDTTEQAKKIASQADLSEYVLILRGKPHDHLGYIRDESARDGYKKARTRIAVFRRLLHNTCTWIPTDEELETGDKLDRSPAKAEPEGECP